VNSADVADVSYTSHDIFCVDKLII